MISLHKNQVKFNSNIIISHTGGRLSSDSGLVLVKEVMDTFKFSDLAKSLLDIKDNRAYYTHDNLAILEQLIMQLIAGYSADSSANLLRQDPVFQMVLGRKQLASQSSISRFKKYSNEGKYTGIFSMLQMFVVTNGVDTKYIAAADGQHINKEFLTSWVDKNNNRVNNYLGFAKEVLSIP